MRGGLLLCTATAQGFVSIARHYSVTPRLAASSSSSKVCTVEIPCELLVRAEQTVLGKSAETSEESDRVSAYVNDALRLGLSLMERSIVSNEAATVAAEFESLVHRLEKWDESNRLGLEKTWTEGEAKQAKTLEKYLGEKGNLKEQVSKLQQELGDPRVSTSIPSATATAVRGAFGEAIAEVKKVVDASDENSELSKFLRSSREDTTRLRLELNKAQEQFAVELKRDLKDMLKIEDDDAEEANAKGRSFELEVGNALRSFASPFGDGVEDTSTTPSRGSKAKVGDILVDFVAEDAKLAVEVKSGAFTMSGGKSLERQIRDAMESRGALVGLGVVKPSNLPKRLGWLTNLREDVAIVAFDPDIEHGSVALECAYKVQRAKALAIKLQQRYQQQQALDEASSALNAENLAREARSQAEALSEQVNRILTSIDRLRRMKRNTTDLLAMLTSLREDLDHLDDEIRTALNRMESDLKPLFNLDREAATQASP